MLIMTENLPIKYLPKRLMILAVQAVRERSVLVYLQFDVMCKLKRLFEVDCAYHPDEL